jgi:predicted AAA+ superfamily ATPase
VLKLMEPDSRPLVLLDSVQSLRDWPERFVELVRTRPQPRIVAAASVAPGAQDDSYDVVTLPSLRFAEFCALRGLPDLGAPPLDLFDPKLPSEADPENDHLFDRVLDPMLADYLVRGGFPEAAFEPDLAIAHQVVRDDVIARAVYQDLPGVVGVAKVAELERVLLATQVHGISPLQVESFADAVELDRQTVGRYLEHLSRAFLLTTLKNYAATTERSRPRVFPTDPAIPNALLERGAGVLAEPEARGSLLVSVIVSHVQEAAFARGFDTAYFREGDLEADLVVVSPAGVMPVVVIDREEVADEDAALVTRLMKRLDAPRAIVLSRARPRRRTPVSFFESVYHMPAAYFLYALNK